ncbi:hypothetical protein BU23DRAFT_552431 [Bimuria novae-zelandiae CBS 107.79]|uniref:Uncharacterized protein n=1 Tax=Bimuria novae-zelandiae CBS 107.79 TaxID=1447943 RepID=A0A6A5VE82_9PLEO|nr:hypothetical protein BU23DRAFT_552431 [Bimuria novae-zelandiae CBS 107.79]
MPEITFIFGPNNSFFFDCPKTWKFHNIPPTLRQLFNSSMTPSWRIAQPFCMALAPQINSPEPVWYVGCKVLAGEEKILYSQNVFDINYPDLSRWTKTIPNAPRSCYVTFGQGYSYFASAPGRGSVWAAIPSELSDKVQKAYDTPCCVALGMNNAWFVLWPDGYYSWKFYGGYNGLDKILTEAEPRSVSYLAISPYNRDHYFVAFKNRTIQYNFTGAPPEWMVQMHEVFAQWQNEIAQAQRPASLQHLPRNKMPYNPNVVSPPSSTGMLSPPMSPMSQQSNITSPPLSPQRPQVYAHYAPVPEPTAVEMPGSLPGGALLEPPVMPATQRPPSVNVKRKKFFSKIFD